MAYGIATILQNLQLKDHLDIDTYAELFASSCTKENPSQSINDIYNILGYSVSWDPPKLQEVSQAIYNAWLHPDTVQSISPNVGIDDTGSPEDTVSSSSSSSFDVPEFPQGKKNASSEPSVLPVNDVDVWNKSIPPGNVMTDSSPSVAVPSFGTLSSPLPSNSSSSRPKGTTTKGKYTAVSFNEFSFSHYPPPRSLSPRTVDHGDDDDDDSVNRVCRHYLAGACLRRDCEFSHDIRRIPCKFWSDPANGCSSGNECKFLHGVQIPSFSSSSTNRTKVIDIRKLDTAFSEMKIGKNDNDEGSGPGNIRYSLPLQPANDNEDTNNNEWLDTLLRFNEQFWEEDDSNDAYRLDYDRNEKDPSIIDSDTILNIDDHQEFPQLPMKTTNNLSTGNSTNTSVPFRSSSVITTSLRTKLLMETLKLVFPYVTEAILRQTLEEHSYNLGQTVHYLQQSTGMEPNKEILERGQRIVHVSSSTSSSSSTALPTYDPRSHQQAKDIALSIARITTGSAVSSLYTAAREKAAAYARARNAAFDRATKAYLTGNRAEAKRYSLQGHDIEILMQNAHKEAAQLIYQSRNMNTQFITSNASLGLRDNEIRIIDLHGLHPTEATVICHDILNTSSSTNSSYRWIGFMVGTRHHSQQGSRSLRSAVWDTLCSRYNENYKLFEPLPGIFLCQRKEL